MGNPHTVSFSSSVRAPKRVPSNNEYPCRSLFFWNPLLVGNLAIHTHVGNSFVELVANAAIAIFSRAACESALGGCPNTSPVNQPQPKTMANDGKVVPFRKYRSVTRQFSCGLRLRRGMCSSRGREQSPLNGWSHIAMTHRTATWEIRIAL